MRWGVCGYGVKNDCKYERPAGWAMGYHLAAVTLSRCTMTVRLYDVPPRQITPPPGNKLYLYSTL